jgi:hypothetical protein
VVSLRLPCTVASSLNNELQKRNRSMMR